MVIKGEKRRNKTKNIKPGQKTATINYKKGHNNVNDWIKPHKTFLKHKKPQSQKNVIKKYLQALK